MEKFGGMWVRQVLEWCKKSSMGDYGATSEVHAKRTMNILGPDSPGFRGEEGRSQLGIGLGAIHVIVW